MAKKAQKKDNKNLIIGICCAVLVVAVIIVAVVFATRGTTKLSDAYFVTDDTKYVVTVNREEGDDTSSADKVHYVFNHSGDKITGAAIYAEFENEDAAKAAFEEYKKENDDNDTVNMSVDGKYIVTKADQKEYENYTLEDIKASFSEQEQE